MTAPGTQTALMGTVTQPARHAFVVHVHVYDGEECEPHYDGFEHDRCPHGLRLVEEWR